MSWSFKTSSKLILRTERRKPGAWSTCLLVGFLTFSRHSEKLKWLKKTETINNNLLERCLNITDELSYDLALMSMGESMINLLTNYTAIAQIQYHTSYCWCNNLRDILVRAKYRRPPPWHRDLSIVTKEGVKPALLLKKEPCLTPSLILTSKKVYGITSPALLLTLCTRYNAPNAGSNT